MVCATKLGGAGRKIGVGGRKTLYFHIHFLSGPLRFIGLLPPPIFTILSKTANN